VEAGVLAGCRALLLGPDPPPPRLGPCSTLWLPAHRALALAGSHAAAIALALEAGLVAFTSPRAPRALYWDAHVHGRLDELLDAFRAVEAAAVGPRTAGEAGRILGVRVSLVAEPHTSEELARRILEAGWRSVAWIRGDPAGRGMRRILKGSGVDLLEVVVYKLFHAPERSRIAEALAKVDYLALTSPSTARAVAGLVPPGVRVVVIGPVTKREARRLGLRVDCAASTHSLEGLSDCINLLETGGILGA
jgi:uroporphyrinogen-III synthase